MFSLLVRGAGWGDRHDAMSAERTFEYTRPDLVARFKPGNMLAVRDIMALPALFLEESSRANDPPARVGTITQATVASRDIRLTYAFDPDIPAIPNSKLRELAPELDIEEFEFFRTHWAIKDIDLFYVLLRTQLPEPRRPRVFQLTEPERIEPTLISAMMPFHPHFDAVYSTLKRTAERVGLHCRRADDIWENPAVIQDVVSLIDRSQVVICDCTGRNPNVFYETGIAHTLGREVILITQVEADIPFDLRHLRYIHYLNNGEGLAALTERLAERLASIT